VGSTSAYLLTNHKKHSSLSFYPNPKVMNLPDIEIVSAKVHEAWMESKKAQGVTTRLAEDGEELMAPYEVLSEKAKQLDRGTVKAVYEAIEAASPKQLDFGFALAAAKEGKRVARAGWNGKGMFVFQRPADALPRSFVAGSIKSLPDSVKEHFEGSTVDSVGFSAYLCLKAVDDTIVNGWLPSQTDMLATDWTVLG
jgi:hypothetical protein